MSFKKGDIVRLKSGGPDMTVTGVIGEDGHLKMWKIQGFEDGDVTVEYFENNKLEKNVFKCTSLELAS